jgi:hypothetical protein
MSVTVAAVCVCAMSPLGHSIIPVFLQVSSPGCFAEGASEALVILRASNQP